MIKFRTTCSDRQAGKVPSSVFPKTQENGERKLRTPTVSITFAINHSALNYSTTLPTNVK